MEPEKYNNKGVLTYKLLKHIKCLWKQFNAFALHAFSKTVISVGKYTFSEEKWYA